MRPARTAGSGVGSGAAVTEWWLNYNELKVEFLAPHYSAEIKLPELSREPKARPPLVEIRDEFKPEGTPKVCETNMQTEGF